MPECYLLSVAAGSSLDQQSNNVTLFNLVEQVNVPTTGAPPAGSRIPLEIHSYLRFSASEIGSEFELRLVLVHSTTGLLTYADPIKHRAATARLRTRSLGLPFPPALGHYDLRVEFRKLDSDEWKRDSIAWPISFIAPDEKPRVTH